MLATVQSRLQDCFPIVDRPGWFFDSWGYEFHDPEAWADLEIPAAPMVSAVSIGGRMPTAAQLAIVRAELDKAPPRILAAWRARSGRCEVVSGRDAGGHPQAPFRCGGFCAGSLIVIAGDLARHATLHELGHAHDDVRIRGGRFSGLADWRQIHRALPPETFARDQCNGDRHFRSDPAESFAECFAKCYHGPLNRAKLPAAARRFVEWAAGQV